MNKAVVTDTGSARPWQVPTGGRPITEALVDEWTRDLEVLRRAPAESGRGGGRGELDSDATPGISVVVACRAGVDVTECLASLAKQTLARERFEVIVVVEGDGDDIDASVELLAEQQPELRVRFVELAGAGVFSVRDIGVAAARRRYLTFVDAGDQISPGYLATLLDSAADDTVTVARTVETGGPVAEAAERTDVAGATTETKAAETKAGGMKAGGTKAADGNQQPAALALTRTTGLLIPTRLAKQVERDPVPRGEQDVLFLMTMLALYDSHVRTSASSDAVYYRRVPSGDELPASDDFDDSVVLRMEIVVQLDALLVAADDEVARLLRQQIDAEVDKINAYLRAHPGDHGRVVAVLDNYDLGYFPHARLNAGLARALAVAYCFAPYNDSSAVVMAKRVRDRGDIVDVVYNVMDKNRDRDTSMLRISGPFVENELPVDTPTYFSNWAAIEAFSQQGLEKIAELERVKGPYERLYSRVMWPASHFLAAAYKLRNPSVEWTAEFSDPAARDVTGLVRSAPITPGPFLDMVRAELERKGIPALTSTNCLDWCEYLAYACADHLVFTNENQRDYMLGYCSVETIAEQARAKATISPHPTLPSAFYSMMQQPYAIDDRVTNIAYFGTFYATRGLGDVISALADLPAETRDRLRLHVFTNNTSDLQKHADEIGIAGSVRVNPYVRFLAFLNLATKFDCLLVNDALTADSHARNPYLPSKWSDYLGSGRPVWGLVEPGSPLSGRPLAYSSPAGDVAAAGEVLRQLAMLAAAPETR